jgi:hypothetical protein
MTIMTMRIKPTRMTSHHLRESDSPSGFAMTLAVFAATLTATVAATTTNLAAVTTTAVANATATALALTNATTTLFRLVDASQICLRCSALLLSLLDAHLLGASIAVCIVVPRLRCCLLSVLHRVVVSPPHLHHGEASMSASLPVVWVVASLCASLSVVCVIVCCVRCCPSSA